MARAGDARAGGPIGHIKETLGAEQERWFLWVPVGVGAGSAAYFAWPSEPRFLPLALALAVSMLGYWFARRRGLLVTLAGLALVVVAGAVVAKLRTEWVRAPVLAAPVTNVDVNGWIELVEPRTSRGQRLTVRVAHISGMRADEMPVLVRVRSLKADATLAPGQPVAFRASLSPPPAPAFPGGYDFGFTAYFMRLGAVGVATGPVARLETLGPASGAMGWRSIVEGIRYSITQRIMTALPGETGAIAAALITGERGGITEDTNNAYRDAGLFHVLSISGLHMVIMAGAMFYVFRLVLASAPALALRYPIKKWAAILALIGALGYLLISGAAFATVRSYIMISVMFFAILCDRPAVALRNVALSALIILLIFPESILDPGFQMSFAAVTALVAVHEVLRERRERREQLGRGSPPLAQPVREVSAIVLSTIIASVAVAPFSIFHFHNTQTLALIANVVAIPVCNMIVMPAALAVLLLMPFGLEMLPLVAMGWGVNVMTWVAEQVALLPGAVARVPAISPLAFALLVGGGLWLLLWSRGWRYAALPVIAAGIAIAPMVTRPDVIIGRDGEAFAVRGTDGQLVLPDFARGQFEAMRWLEIDGDRRSRRVADMPRISGKPRGGSAEIPCDVFGCLARSGGKELQVLSGAGGLRDACGQADVIVLRFNAGDVCRTQRFITGERVAATTASDVEATATEPTPLRPLVIDAARLRHGGVHLLYFEGTKVRIRTAEQGRADRPWGSRGDLPDDPRRRLATAVARLP